MKKNSIVIFCLILVDRSNPKILASRAGFQNIVVQTEDHVNSFPPDFGHRFNAAERGKLFSSPDSNRRKEIALPMDLFTINKDDWCCFWDHKAIRSICIGSEKSSCLHLRGGGKKSKSKSVKDDSKIQREKKDINLVTRHSESKQRAVVPTRSSQDRSAMLSELAAGMEIEDQSKAKLSIQRVEQLRRALARRDKTAVSNALEKVGSELCQS